MNKALDKDNISQKSADSQVSLLVDTSIERHSGFLIPVLQDIQEEHNYLPEDALRAVAQKLNISLSDVCGVASFYKTFSFTPKGKYIITVCVGTACHVRGGARIVDAISQKLGIEPGETTEDMNFTLETVNCLGACALGPIIVVNGEYHGQMTKAKAVRLLKEIRKSESVKQDE